MPLRAAYDHVSAKHISVVSRPIPFWFADDATNSRQTMPEEDWPHITALVSFLGIPANVSSWTSSQHLANI